MYREIITRRKSFIIISTLIGITIMLYIRELIYLLLEYNNDVLTEINILCILAILILTILELRTAILAYRYSIIANKLIINKIIWKKEKNIVSIKIPNIVYLGEKEMISDEYKKVHITNNFCCGIFTKNKSVCIYKEKEELQAFSFSPSKKFKEKVKIYS